ncbi:MAG: hypothetical protein LC667_05800 [Thioalkalivibrio sp.]|nr:hypothetical protein [Thioalkalivibrio sp.]
MRTPIVFLLVVCAGSLGCSIHSGPPPVVKPYGGVVEIELHSGTAYRAEALALYDDDLALDIDGRAYLVPFAAIVRARIVDFNRELTRPTAEQLRPHLRWPQGLNSDQWREVLEAYGQERLQELPGGQ